MSLRVLAVVNDGDILYLDDWIVKFQQAKEESPFGVPPILCFDLGGGKVQGIECLPLGQMDAASLETMVQEIHEAVCNL